MADNPEVPQQQQQHQEGEDNETVVQQHDQLIENQWQTMTYIINTQVIDVRQEAIDNRPPAKPWINLVQKGRQQLAIAGNNIAVEVKEVNRQTFARLGTNYKVRTRPVVYDDSGQHRWMVETCITRGYYALFTYGICGSGGPQAELMVEKNALYLLVIDEQTAVALRNQSVNQADGQSLVYLLIWSIHFLTIMWLHLYQWSDGNASDDQILSLRQMIYISTDQCCQQLRCAIRSKNIYRKAIVVVEVMDRLVLNNPCPPFRLPLPPTIDVPAIVTPNIQQSVAKINAIVQEITNSPMFTRNWQQMFDRFASLRTSVPIVELDGQKANQVLAEQTVYLNNYHRFEVKVDVGTLQGNQWTYRIRSGSFSESYLNSYYVWPVDDQFEPFQVNRCTYQHNYIPLYSHGLAGSYDDDLQGGNNGFQVTTLNFPDINELNHRRLYFVNRAMAMELRQLIEIDDPLDQYHRWFLQLIEMSLMVCDLRQWYRSVAGLVDDDQWLTDIQNCSQQLFAIPDQLFRKYTIISRLEQLWNHSILVPHIENGEPKVKYQKTCPGLYSDKKSDNKRKSKNPKEIAEQPSGLTGQKKQRTN